MGKINFRINGHVEEELFFRTRTKKGLRDRAGVAAMLAAREIAERIETLMGYPDMPDALEEADSLITQVVNHLERWRVYLKEFLENEGRTPTHCPGCGGRKIQVNHVTRFPGKLAFLNGRLHEGVDSTEKLERYDDGVILQCQDCTHNWEITTQELDGLMQKMDRGAEEDEVWVKGEADLFRSIVAGAESELQIFRERDEVTLENAIALADWLSDLIGISWRVLDALENDE